MKRLSSADEAGLYEILVTGRLNSRWATWFDGLTLTQRSDGTTAIHGVVVDQSALHGLLTKVRDTGLPLISVSRIALHTLYLPSARPSRTNRRLRRARRTHCSCNRQFSRRPT